MTRYGAAYLEKEFRRVGGYGPKDWKEKEKRRKNFVIFARLHSRTEWTFFDTGN